MTLTTPPTRTSCPAPTYTATEALSDGRERVLVTGLTYCEMLAHHFPADTWNVTWTVDPTPGTTIRKP